MSVMLAKLEESFRSLVNKTSERSTVEKNTQVVKKRSLESYEDEPAAKRPRLLVDDAQTRRKSSGISLTGFLKASKEKFVRFTSWVLKGVSRDEDRVMADPMRKPAKPYYYPASPVLGGNFGGPYGSTARPAVNPGFGDYRAQPMSTMAPGHSESASMGRGAVPKIGSQTAWNKSSGSAKVPQRQFVKNSTGIPFIQSGYLHTPYRPVQEKIFTSNGGANRNNSDRPPKSGLSGAKESSRLTEKKRYEELLKNFTSVPLGQCFTGGNSADRSSLFGSFDKSRDTSVKTSKPIVVDLCRTPGPISFTAERSRDYITPMNLNTWERKYSQKSQRSSTPITEQPRKESVQAAVHTPRVTTQKSTHEIGAKSPAVAQFEKMINESKCMTNWIEDVADSLNSDSLRKERAIREAQLQVQHCEERKDLWEQEMVYRIKRRLRLASQEPGVIEDVYAEEEKEEEEDEFPELSDEASQMVSMALRPGPPGEKLSEGFRLQITRADMATLAGLNWLNDEIINFYMEMIKDRGEAEGRPKIHAFNTFFYPKIAQSGQQSVRRWTKRVNIFEKDFLLIPVHLGMHWCLCVVDFKAKAIRFYDSMKGQGRDILQIVKQYLMDEKKDKQGEDFDFTDWNFVTMKDIPPQLNGSDCGVFTCKYADYISLNKKITFTQENMPYFRRRMVYEILTKKLMMT